MSRLISEPRKVRFYVGTGLMLVGAFLFLSVLFTFVINIGHNAIDTAWIMTRAFFGLFALFVGGAVRLSAGRGAGGPVIAVRCPACGKSNPPGAKSCEGCGAAL